ncbi:MAG: hypothetical protein AABX11_03625 [Nanoarchaeota archaeon]
MIKIKKELNFRGICVFLFLSVLVMLVFGRMSNLNIVPVLSPSNYYPTNENVLCIYNSNSQFNDSKKICDYYLEKRPGAKSLGFDIPVEMFAPKDGTHGEYNLVGASNFEERVINPLMSYLGDNPSWNITHLAVAKYIPYRIHNATHMPRVYSGVLALANPSSYDYSSSYSQNNLGNPYYLKSVHFNPEDYRSSNGNYTIRFAVSYLMAFSLEDVKHMIDKAVSSSDENAVFLIDGDFDGGSIGHGDVFSNSYAFSKAGITPDSVHYDFNDSNINFDKPVSFFVTSGVHHVNYGINWMFDGKVIVHPTNRSIMGSYVSYNGINFDEAFVTGQDRIASSLTSNAYGGQNYSRSFAGAFGHFEEPSIGAGELYNDMIRGWGEGLTLGESFLSAMVLQDSGFGIVVGDPLMTREEIRHLKLANYEPCISNADCESGKCGFDAFANQNKCEVNDNRCVYGTKEYANGGSFCKGDLRGIYNCLNGNWNFTLLDAYHQCNVVASSQIYYPDYSSFYYFSNLSAEIVTRTGESCNINSDCLGSGLSCLEDVTGVKRCASLNGQSCLLDESRKMIPNGFFGCSSASAKRQCVNGNWSLSITNCNGECSLGVCEYEQNIINGMTLSLNKNRSYIFNIPFILFKRNLSEIFSSNISSLYVYIHSSLQSFSFDDIDNVWIPYDYQLKLGDVLYIPNVLQNSIFNLSGVVVNYSVPINLTSGLNAFAIPFCAENYTARKVLSELNSLGVNCSKISKEIREQGPDEWYSLNDSVTQNSIKKNFQIKNFEGYFVQCEISAPRIWTPSCNPETSKDIRLVKSGNNNRIFYKGVELINIFSQAFNENRLENIFVLGGEQQGKSYVIISNLTLVAQENKTIFIKKNSLLSNSVCIYDSANVHSVQEIINNCFVLSCPGAGGGYSCQLEGGYFKVGGLRNSGIIENVYTSGLDVNESDEGRDNRCFPSWECVNTSCQYGTFRNICTDYSCGLSDRVTGYNCSSENINDSNPVNPIIPSNESGNNENQISGIYLWMILILAVGILVVFVLIIIKLSKRD